MPFPSRRGVAAGLAAAGPTAAFAVRSAAAQPSAVHVRRLGDGPIIAPGMDARMGADIEGPSLIRTPDWLPGRLGRYYLYFADHKGDYIRLAYADRLAGPWKVHAPGSLQLAQSGLPTARLQPTAAQSERLASRTSPDSAPAGTPGVPSPLDDAVLPHIASPDVHVDDGRRRIVMYFHGLTDVAVQRTRAAVSTDGVRFQAVTGDLGGPYLRAFDHGGRRYAFTMPGQLLRSREGFGDFETGPRLFGENQRHLAVLVRGDTLNVFWTRVGDAPERIYLSRVDMGRDWTAWKAGEPVEVLRPERAWEGAGLPVERSYRSATFVSANQLRDPAIYEEDGRVYLLYAVKGEAGIAIAELTGL